MGYNNYALLTTVSDQKFKFCCQLCYKFPIIFQHYLGETPCHKTARAGSMECISLLVSQVNSVTAWSVSAYWCLGSILLQHGVYQPAGVSCRFCYSMECVSLLVSRVNCNLCYTFPIVFQDYLGETPCHKAARTGSMECISLLVSQGAKLE